MSSPSKKKKTDGSATQKLKQGKICFTPLSSKTVSERNPEPSSSGHSLEDPDADHAGSNVTEMSVERVVTSERNPEATSSSHDAEEAVANQNNIEASDLDVEHATDDMSEVIIPTAPFHPPRSFKFPPTVIGKQKRSCQAHWFQDTGFPWLHYNEQANAVFCFPCMKQNSLSRLNSVPKKEQAFISTGYSSWKDALLAFRTHEASECHGVSITYEYIVPTCGNIREMTDTVLSAMMLENRKCFLKIVDSVQYFGRQAIAMQGKTDAESNFIQLLRLRSKDYKPLKKWLERKTDRYTSHDIQNELLNLMAQDVIRGLMSDIKGGKCSYFSLIADEYTDIANHEQLTICFRWIDENLDAHKDFAGFYRIPNIKAQTIETALKDALIRLQLSLNDCRGQCYDGASNMLGKGSGVATRIKAKQPKAFEMHCHCHSLSLSVKDATKGSKILTAAMDYSKEVVLLIKLSPKREYILGEIKDNLEGEIDLLMEQIDDERTPGLAKFSATRWTVRSGCFNRIFINYAALQQVWDECLKQGGLSVDIRGRVIGCQSQMKSFDFFFGLLLGSRLFSHTDNLSKTLQDRRMPAVSGQRVAMQTVETLKRMQSDTSFDAFYESILKKKKGLDVKDSALKRPKQAPVRFATGSAPYEHPTTAKDLYRKHYFEAIDLLTSHIKERFDQPSYKIFLRLESLLLDSLVKEVVELEDDISFVKETYGDDVDTNRLPAQLESFKTFVMDENVSCFLDILQSVKKLSTGERSNISEVITIINLLNVNPSSSATGERSFSAARRILTWQRSTMTQERFNNCTVLNTHKDRTDRLNLVDIANSFVCNENRKRHFGTFISSDSD